MAIARDDLKRMKRDAFIFFYEYRTIGITYEQLYTHLINEGYSIENEGNELFRINSNVTEIFSSIVQQEFNYSGTFEYAQKHRADLAKVSKANLEVPYFISDVFYINKRSTEKSAEDIYVISLQYFRDNWEDGATYIEYAYHIRNEKNLFFNDNTLIPIYREIVSMNQGGGLAKNTKHWATIESIFRLLEYEELKHSLKESKDARKEAKWAIGISIVTFLVSIGFSLWQINADTKIDRKQFQEIKDIAQLEKEQNDKLIFLMEKENQILTDTLNVKVQTKKKKR